MNRFTKRVLILAVFVLCLFGLTILGASAASTEGYETDAAAIAADSTLVARVGGTATSNEGATYYTSVSAAAAAVTDEKNVVWVIQTYTEASAMPAWSALGAVTDGYTISSVDPENITLTFTKANAFDMGSSAKAVSFLNIKMVATTYFVWANGHGMVFGEGCTLDLTGAYGFTVKGNAKITVKDGAVINASANTTSIFKIDNSNVTVTVTDATINVPNGGVFAGGNSFTLTATNETINGKLYAEASNFTIPVGTYSTDADAIAAGATVRIGAEGAAAKYFTNLPLAISAAASGDTLYVLASHTSYATNGAAGSKTLIIEGVKNGDVYPTITETHTNFVVNTGANANVTLKNLNIVTNGATFQTDSTDSKLYLVNTNVHCTSNGGAYIVTMWGASSFSLDKDSSIIIDAAVTTADMDVFYGNSSWAGTITIAGVVENHAKASGTNTIVQMAGTGAANIILNDGAKIALTHKGAGRANMFRVNCPVTAVATNLGDIVLTAVNDIRTSPGVNKASSFTNVVFNMTTGTVMVEAFNLLTLKNCAFVSHEKAVECKAVVRVGAETVVVDGVTYVAGYYDDAAEAAEGATAAGKTVKLVTSDFTYYVASLADAVNNASEGVKIYDTNATDDSKATVVNKNGAVFTVYAAEYVDVADLVSAVAVIDGTCYTSFVQADAAAAENGMVCRVGATYYNNVATAFRAAVADSELYLLGDASASLTVTIGGKSVTLFTVDISNVDALHKLCGALVKLTDAAAVFALGEVDGVYYDNFDDAIAAANGKVLNLLDNVDLGSTSYDIDGVDVAINGNGYTISMDGTANHFALANGASLTIVDTTLESAGKVFDLGAGENALTLDADTTVTGAMTAATSRISVSAGTATITVAEGAKIEVTEGSTKNFAVISVAEGAKIVYEQAGAVEVDTDTEATLIDDANTTSQGSSYTFNADSVVDFTAGSGTLFNTNEKVTLDNMLLNANGADLGNAELGPNMAISNDEQAIQSGYKFRIGEVADQKFYKTWAEVLAAINAAGTYNVFVLTDTTETAAKLTLNQGYKVTISGVDKGNGTYTTLTFTGTTNLFVLNGTGTALTIENITMVIGGQFMTTDSNNGDSYFTLAAGAILKTAANWSGSMLFQIYDPATVTFAAGSKLDTSATTFTAGLNMFAIDKTHFASGKIIVNGEILFGGTGAASAQYRMFNATDGFQGEIEVNSPAKITYDVRGALKDTSGIFIAYGEINIKGGTLKITAATNGGYVVYHNSAVGDVMITGNTVMIHESAGVILNRNGGSTNPLITVNSENVQLIAKDAATIFNSPYYIHVYGAYMSCEAASPYVKEATHATFINVKFPTAEMATKFGYQLRVDNATVALTVEGETVNALAGYYFSAFNYKDVLYEAIKAIPGDSAQHTITLYSNLTTKTAHALVGTAAGSHKILIESAEGKSYTITEAIDDFWLVMKSGAQVTFRNVNINSNGAIVQVDAGETETILTFAENTQVTMNGAIKGAIAIDLWNNAQFNLNSGASITVPATADLSGDFYAIKVENSFKNSVNLAGDITISASANATSHVQRIIDTASGFTGTINITAGNYIINSGKSTASSSIIMSYGKVNVTGGTLKITNNSLGMVIAAQSGSAVKVSGTAHLEHTGTATAGDHCFVLYRYGGTNAIEVDGGELFAYGSAVILEQGYGVKHIKNCTIYSEGDLLCEEEYSYCVFQNIKFISLEEAQRMYVVMPGSGTKRTNLSTIFFGTLNGSEGYYDSYYMFNKCTNPTIGLIGDLELNHGWFPNGVSCTIDGNGFTMTLTKGSGGANAILLNGGSTLTFRDITVIGANGYIARVYDGCHLILDEGAHLINYAYSGTNRGIQLDSTGSLTIKAGASLGIPAENQTQLTGGYNVIQTSGWTGTIDIAGELYACHTTNDWTFPVRVYDGGAGQVIVRSTAVITQATTGLSSNACLMFSNNQAGTLVKVEEGATFNTSTGRVGYCYNMPSIADDYTAGVLGFSFRVGTDTKVVHGQTVYANYFADFGAAYSAVAHNGTVFVVGNFNFGSGQATFEAKTVTFKGVKADGNWPTITMDGSKYHFLPKNGAHVTFEDLILVSQGRFAQPQQGTNKSTIVFAGETLLASPLKVGDCLFSLAGGAEADIIIREDAAIGIIDGGSVGNTYVIYMNTAAKLNLVIEGGFFNYADKADGTAGFHNGLYSTASHVVSLTIKPTAYLYHGSKNIQADSTLFRIAGNITVEGGTFENELAPIFLLLEGTTLNIKEGMFCSSGPNSYGPIDTLDVMATVNIYGGYFEGKGISALSVTNGSVYNIYGGAFNYTSEGNGVVIATGYGDTEGTLNVFGGAFRSVSKTAPVFAALYSNRNQLNLKCFVASSYANLITNIGSGYRTSDHFDALLGRSTLNGFEVTTGADPVFVAGSMAMRFKATLSKTAVEQAMALADQSNITLGMLAIPTALYEDLVAYVGSEAVPYHMYLTGMSDVIDIVADMQNDVTFEGDGCITIRVTLADVDPNTAYSVIFYAKYNVNGNVVYNYSDYVSSKNSRSMAQVARAALNDLSDNQSVEYPNATSGGKYSPYTAEQQEIMLNVCGGNAALLPLDLYVIAGGSSAAGNTTLTEWQMNNVEVGFANIFSSGFITSTASQTYGGRRFQQSTRKYTTAGTLAWVGQGIGADMIGPELGMAAALADYYTAGSGKYAAVVKYTAEDLSMSKVSSYYKLLTEAIQNEIDTYRIMGYDVNIVGAYWMQGEADYNTASVLNTYSAKFNALVNDLRADLGEMINADLSAMPVVVGEIGISYTKTNTENEVAFIEMQNGLDEIVGLDNVHVVKSSDFTSLNDVFVDMKDVLLNGEIVATTLMANGAHRSGAASVTIPEIEMLVELVVDGGVEPVTVPMRSVAKALYLAPDGATVKLLANMEESETFVLDGVNDITLDGNNGQFGIVSTATGAAIEVSNANLIFKDFNISIDVGPEAVAVQIADNAKVSFNGNSEITSSGKAFVLNGKDAKLTVDGAEIATVDTAIDAINGNVTVVSGVVNSATGACIDVDFDAAYRLVVNIKGGEFYAPDVAIVNNSVYAVLVISNTATINGAVVNAGFGSGNPEYDIFAA